MRKNIEWKINSMKVSKKADLCFLSKGEINKVRRFHESFPQYKQTPLVNLSKLSKKLGVQGIYVKDESFRFGLNAFKVLGASYAMSKYLSQKLGVDISQLDYEKLISNETRNNLGNITFVTATDGNHGRAVAWTAARLKQKSVVYMPKGSSHTRLENIRKEGAEASITDLNYDDSVRLAAENAKKHGWVVVQDTAWEGYKDIPAWIMQGYGTMASEALEQLIEYGIERPTHIFVQAGVGSLAGAIVGYFASVFKDNCPTTVVVEADKAACLYKSAVYGDGSPHIVSGDMPTIMAGLACGEPNIIAWEVLKSYSNMFVSCPDWVSAKGMRILSNPLKNDEKIVSGESGAVTLGLLVEILIRSDLNNLREALNLNADSNILLFSTEGDTDPEKYLNIVWDGEYPSY